MKIKAFLLLLLILAIPLSSRAQMAEVLEIANISLDKNDSQRLIALPFGFLTTSTELALGAGVIARGYGQKHLSMVAAGYYSENDSSGFAGGIYNYKLNNISPRLSIDMQNFQMNTTNDQLYFSFDRDDNSNSEIVEGESSMNDFLLRLNYKFKTRNKFKIEVPKNSDGEYLDSFIITPHKKGDLIASISYFYSDMELKEKNESRHKGVSSGAILGLEYDNRNHKASPSVGNRIRTYYTKDFGNEYNGAYEKFEIDLAQYFSLSHLTEKLFEQSVIATNVYFSNVFSHESDDVPAWFAASNLGGQQRLRGYNSSRFVGKTATYASAELRLLSNTRYLKKIKYLNLLDIPWWQLITFFELGNTSNKNYVDDFFTKPHLSYGAGISLFVEGLVVRGEIAAGEESSYMRVRINQPF